jgi:hypothetical protein
LRPPCVAAQNLSEIVDVARERVHAGNGFHLRDLTIAQQVGLRLEAGSDERPENRRSIIDGFDSRGERIGCDDVVQVRVHAVAPAECVLLACRKREADDFAAVIDVVCKYIGRAAVSRDRHDAVATIGPCKIDSEQRCEKYCESKQPCHGDLLFSRACALLLRTPVCPAAHGSSAPNALHARVTNASTGGSDSRYCARASTIDGPVGNSGVTTRGDEHEHRESDDVHTRTHTGWPANADTRYKALPIVRSPPSVRFV